MRQEQIKVGKRYAKAEEGVGQTSTVLAIDDGKVTYTYVNTIPLWQFAMWADKEVV